MRRVFQLNMYSFLFSLFILQNLRLGLIRNILRNTHRRSVKNKTGGAKACKIKLGGQRRKKVI